MPAIPDALLNLVGSGTTFQADLASTTTGPWVFVGKGRRFDAELRIGGDVTWTNPTLDMLIQYSNDAGASDGTDVTFPQQTDEQVGYIATTTPRYEVPGEDPIIKSFRASDDYIRASWTVGGTSTPTFKGVSVLLRVLHDADSRMSGVA